MIGAPKRENRDRADRRGQAWTYSRNLSLVDAYQMNDPRFPRECLALMSLPFSLVAAQRRLSGWREGENCPLSSSEKRGSYASKILKLILLGQSDRTWILDENPRCARGSGLTHWCRRVFHKTALVESSGPVTGCQVLVFEEDLVAYEPSITKQFPRKSVIFSRAPCPPGAAGTYHFISSGARFLSERSPTAAQNFRENECERLTFVETGKPKKTITRWCGYSITTVERSVRCI